MENIYKKSGWLAMAAALVIEMTACSSDDSIAEEPKQPVENPTAEKTFTMTVLATKGDATTRALSLDGTKLNASWAEGEEVSVYNETTGKSLTGTDKKGGGRMTKGVEARDD